LPTASYLATIETLEAIDVMEPSSKTFGVTILEKAKFARTPIEESLLSFSYLLFEHLGLRGVNQ
jgi:hypothetical protein